jgi:hypothetical protein
VQVDLSKNFARFVENISLGEPQVSRMNTAAAAIATFLRTTYGLSADAVFLQGSYANGTAVEPVAGGEYDIDIVCVCVDGNTTSNAALTELESVFRSDGRFAGRVKPKKPCVRLEYAEDGVGSFHADVVPVRVHHPHPPPLDAPRRDEDWHATAPAEYTAWCSNQGPAYVRTVKMMKRWRDEQQTVRNAIKSIVLQVLVAGCMPRDVVDDGARLAQTFIALRDSLAHLDGPPVVHNPVLTSENLAARWSRESFLEFTSELREAVDWACVATASTDPVEAADAWREVLGDDFPAVEPGHLGIRLSDYSHARAPSDMGWVEALDPNYTVSVGATVQRGKRGQNRRTYPNNGPLVFAGHKLWFKAHVKAPHHAAVWWQVANTGGHARHKSGLRGEIFRGRTLDRRPTTDESENWEDTAFTGSHLIRALLVRDDRVVARSDWFRVNIYAKGWSFRP